MKRMFIIGALATTSFALSAGCDKKSAGEGGASSSASAASSAKPNAAATTTAAPAANLPVKGPWDAIKITFTKKDPDGSPHFNLENTGGKTVTVIFIDYWAYDAKGHQVGHKDLGFNLPLKPGASHDISTSTIKDADSWEATYHGLQFEGDAKATTDDKRAPAKRAKGAP
jgi:hypothetical protein